jgi:hypothetical protein
MLFLACGLDLTRQSNMDWAVAGSMMRWRQLALEALGSEAQPLVLGLRDIANWSN